jgi:AcrR family transcriptional regulator
MTAVTEIRAGRRMSAEREQELFDTVIELLREVGYEAMTMDAVSARARVSKATLYRQWGGKPTLVATALRSIAPVAAADVDTGSLRGDLLHMSRSAAARQQRDQDLMLSLAHAMTGDPELRKAFHAVMIEPERRGLEGLLARAVARGEIAADRPAGPYFIYMLLGAALGRKILDDAEPDEEFMTAYIDAVVLPALGL